MLQFLFELVFRVVWELILRLISYIVDSIFIQPIRNILHKRHQNHLQSLGYEEVSQRIGRRSTHWKIFLIHLMVFFGVVLILMLMVGNRLFHIQIDLGGWVGIWAIFVLIPHLLYVIFYAIRWSPNKLEMLEKAKNDVDQTVSS